MLCRISAEWHACQKHTVEQTLSVEPPRHRVPKLTAKYGPISFSSPSTHLCTNNLKLTMNYAIGISLRKIFKGKHV
jgi:hypothetical protein